MTRIVSVGHNTVDKYITQGMMYPGGNEVNVAVHTARHGMQSSYIGWLGNDHYGELINNALKAEHVDITHCQIKDDVTTYTPIFLKDGERSFGTTRKGASTRFQLSDEDLEFIRTHDLLFTSYYSHMEEFLVNKPEHMQICFDFTDDVTEEYLQQYIPLVDIAIIPVKEEIEDITVLLENYKAMGAKLLLVTLGSQGAYIYDDTIYYAPSVKGDVIDTLGAGDAFLAKFLVEYFKGTSQEEAIKLATEYAYATCFHFGAFGYGTEIID